MNTLLLMALLLDFDDPPPKPTSARPTALVLRVKGKVRAGMRIVEQGDFLLPGEVVSAATDAEALLVFLVRGERRRLKPGGRTTLTRDDCDPAEAVEKLGEARLSRKNLTKVREVEVREGGGVGVLRSGKPSSEARVAPLFGTFIMTDRPTFSWPPVAQAEGYVLELKDGAGRRWKAATKEARLDYPPKEKPLEFGQLYLWTVQAQLPGGAVKMVVDESNFKVLFKGEPEALAPVQKLAGSDAPEDLLLAAAAYEGYGVHDEALRMFEKLARLEPRVPRYQLALARYYRHGGRTDKAKEALEKARRLGAAVKE